jgi:hypothetical protein
MRAILIHGMGRTPLAMAPLAARLRAAGMDTALFGYVAAVERWDGCLRRLQSFIERRAGPEPYILVGHSLGTVLTRAVLPQLARPPAACFFIAPPTLACRLARRLAPRGLYRLLTGEMGQLLANPEFMDALPLPEVPVRIYSGTAGPRGRHSPFGAEPNDGVLAVGETLLPGVPVLEVRALHTFVMNNRSVAEDIVRAVRELSA